MYLISIPSRETLLSICTIYVIFTAYVNGEPCCVVRGGGGKHPRPRFSFYYVPVDSQDINWTNTASLTSEIASLSLLTIYIGFECQKPLKLGVWWEHPNYLFCRGKYARVITVFMKLIMMGKVNRLCKKNAYNRQIGFTMPRNLAGTVYSQFL